MNKCPQNPDAEVKKTLRTAYAKDSMPKHCSFLAKKVRAVNRGCDTSLVANVGFAVPCRRAHESPAPSLTPLINPQDPSPAHFHSSPALCRHFPRPVHAYATCVTDDQQS